MKLTKIHYTYKITNLNPTDKRLYYIGVRSTTKSSPNLDTNYRSSSKYLKDAIKEIGHNNFSKEILSTWETRELAVLEEIRLHQEFDVAKNPLFYNKSKQTSTGFDTTGQVTVKNEYGNTFNVDINDTRYISGELKHISVGRKHKESSKIKMSQTKLNTPEDEKAYTNNLRSLSAKKRFASMNSSEYSHFCNSKKEEWNKRTNESVTNATKKRLDTMSAWDNERRNTFKQLLSKKQSGSNNGNAYKINIYNNKNVLQHSCNGNFKYICETNNLPFHNLRQSYNSNGARIHINLRKSARTTLIKNNRLLEGWYAIKE